MKRLLIVLVASMALDGCAGYFLMTGTKSEEDCSKDSSPASYANYVPPDFDYRFTKAKLLKLSGKPDKTIAIKGGEAWYYKQGLKWRGIVLYVGIIPIPLALPVGRDYEVWKFSGEVCNTREIQRDLNQFALCGLVTYLPPYACYRENMDEN